MDGRREVGTEVGRNGEKRMEGGNKSENGKFFCGARGDLMRLKT